MVLHGLRTKSVNWGLVAEHSATVVHSTINIQLDVSNDDWGTDCSHFCPVVRRHISDFSGQHVFAYSGMSAMPDLIKRMEHCGLVWRPLPDCKNVHCQRRSVEEDSNHDSSW